MAKKYKKSFFIDMNMQNPPKPAPMDWFVRKEDENSEPEFTVCGYEFTVDRREDSFGVAEGSSPDFNFRRIFLPEEGHYWLSRDFAGQELRIMANLSNEPAWINAFLNGEDIHKATAITIWGKENFTPKRRNMAKAINFGLLYGSTAIGIASNTGTTEREAQKLINDFFNKLPNIERYLKRCEIDATQNKEISNVYGRKRRMHNFINAYGKLIPAGVRRSYNYPIQSTGADITKLALLRIYKGLIKSPNYIDKVYFMNTIHDEVNLSVRKDLICEVAKLAGELMLHKMGKMPVPINAGLEIGNSMGLTWKFKQNEETLELTPVTGPLQGV